MTNSSSKKIIFSGGKPKAFSLAVDDTDLTEGDSAVFSIATTGIPAGTTLYWTTDGVGITERDFTDSDLTGSFTLSAAAGAVSDSAEGSVVRVARIDNDSEGTESFTLNIRTGSVVGPIVATSPSVLIRDPSATYSVTRVYSTRSEGQTVVFNVNTTYVPHGTTLYWNFYPSGTSSTANSTDTSPDNGSVVITNTDGINGTATITSTITNDSTAETAETIYCYLYTNSITSGLVAVSPSPTTINASDLPEVYLYSTVGGVVDNSVDEGDTVTFYVYTNNFSAGTYYYGLERYDGATQGWWLDDSTPDYGPSELSSGSATGSFTISSGSFNQTEIGQSSKTFTGRGTFSVTIDEDVLTEGTEYWYTHLYYNTPRTADGNVSLFLDNTGDFEIGLDEIGGTFSGTTTIRSINDTSTAPVIPSTPPLILTVNATSTSNVTILYAEIGGVIDWGDGTIDNIEFNTENHAYSSTGSKTIKVYGDIGDNGQFGVSGSGLLTDVTQWGGYQVKNIGQLLAYDTINGVTTYPNLTASDTPEFKSGASIYALARNNTSFNPSSISSWDTSNVTNTMQAFKGATSFSRSLSSWNTYKVTNMSGMFEGCTSFNQSVSSWDVRNVTNMSSMFRSTRFFNQSFNWNTHNVTNFYAFLDNDASSTFNSSITLNTVNATNMAEMFQGCTSFNQSVSSFNTHKVTNMFTMFSVCSAFTGSGLSGFNTGNVTNMRSMFSSCSAMNASIGGWDVSKVTSMSNMFNDCDTFNQSLNSWDTRNVTNMSSMFSGARAFNGSIGSWNTYKVTSMFYMFDRCDAFDQNISSWDTRNVITMAGMFQSCDVFNQNISGWNTYKVTSMNSMFLNAFAFNQPIGSWDTRNVTTMSFMFSGPGDFNQNINGWNTYKVTNMSYMFYSNLTFNNSVGGWDVSNVTNMTHMFRNADSFNQSLSGWNTAGVTTMAYMFQDNSAFDQNISGWNVISVTNSYRFDYNTNVNWLASEKPTFPA